MVNFPSRSKARTVGPKAALKKESTGSAPSMAEEGDNLGLSEASLRKLPRAQLQKVAMAHKVRANMKTDRIIQQLVNLQKPKRSRPSEDDAEAGPSRKRVKREAPLNKSPVSSMPESRVGTDRFSGVGEIEIQSNAAVVTSVEDPQQTEAGPSAPRLISPEHTVPTDLPYDQDLFSGTESEMTEEDQLDFTTPVSSRAGTPPLANPNDLRRCVQIMREISAKDVALLKEVMDQDETARKLRERVKDLRDLAKAERGRRERMETYFRHWQDMQPRWDRRWLYGEKLMSDREIRLQELDDVPAGPPTVAARQRDQEEDLNGRTSSTTPVHARMSPEQLRQRRQAIVSKQEAERCQLATLQRRDELGEGSSGVWSSEASGALAHGLSE